MKGEYLMIHDKLFTDNVFLQKNEPIYFDIENLLENASIFNEDYFGKKPQLIEVEKILAQLKLKMYPTEKTKKEIYNPNKKEELKKIGIILGKMFGFEKVNITVHPNHMGVNAYTIPFLMTDTYDEKFLEMEYEKGVGIKYKNSKDKTLTIVVYSYLFKNFSPEEILSIILHEVGHNFFIVTTNSKKFKLLFMTSFFIGIVNYLIVQAILISKMEWDPNKNPLISLNIFRVLLSLFQIIFAIIDFSIFNKDPKKYIDSLTKITDRQYKAEEKEVPDRNASKIQLVVMNIVGSLLMFLQVKFLLAVVAPILLVSGVIDLILDRFLMQGYDNEKFSDNFASSFGYGPALARVFASKKVTLEKDLTQDIPLYNIYSNLSDFLTTFVFAFSDPHPDSYIRVTDVKKKLEYELKNNKDYLTNGQIKEITKQIAEMDSIISLFNKNSSYINTVFSKLGLLKIKELIGQRYKMKDIYDFKERIIDKVFKKERN